MVICAGRANRALAQPLDYRKTVHLIGEAAEEAMELTHRQRSGTRNGADLNAVCWRRTGTSR